MITSGWTQVQQIAMILMCSFFGMVVAIACIVYCRPRLRPSSNQKSEIQQAESELTQQDITNPLEMVAETEQAATVKEGTVKEAAVKEAAVKVTRKNGNDGANEAKEANEPSYNSTSRIGRFALIKSKSQQQPA